MNGLLYDIVLAPFEAMNLGKLREELLSHAHGKILEIGSGTGLNLPYYPQDTVIIGIEPDRSMRHKSLERAENFHAQVMDGDAMALPFPDEEFDTVVGTLVFCTIPDPQKAMEEVHRVLKPGGTFLLLEHVRKNTPVMGKLLDVMTPLWFHIADGCHLNRDPSDTIKRLDFKTQEYRTIWKGLGKLWVLEK